MRVVQTASKPKAKPAIKIEVGSRRPRKVGVGFQTSKGTFTPRVMQQAKKKARPISG